MSEVEQAVVETPDAGATPPVEEANAQDELDTLLGEFSAETEPTPPAESSAEANKLDEVHAMLQDGQKKEALRVTNERITESVKTFKEAAGTDISDDMVETLLHGKAAKDARFAKAFIEAENNPAAWDSVVKAMAKEYAAIVSAAPDPDATADQDAVVAAVHSASTKAPAADAPGDDEVATMSTGDFNDLQRELGVDP